LIFLIDTLASPPEFHSWSPLFFPGSFPFIAYLDLCHWDQQACLKPTNLLLPLQRVTNPAFWRQPSITCIT
jgi:hypothetical protein